MCRLVCVTAKQLCKIDFCKRINEISKTKVDKIILREKYLSEEDYYTLAQNLLTACEAEKLVIHSFVDVAIKLGVRKIHLPFEQFKNYKNTMYFDVVGTSVHSVEDAVYAETHGADYIVAGHIFETDCKKGLTGRGVDFLRSVCDSVKIPVYAVGGINTKTACQLKNIKNKNFAGVCVMSELMQSESVAENVEKILNELR